MSAKKTILAVGALTATVLSVAPAVAGADESGPAPTVVVSGLNNPRQLSLVHDRQLLIAEAGKGGPTEVDSDQGPTFVGYSGSVSQVADPQTAEGTAPNRVVTGLLSAGGSPDGLFSVGSDGVSARGVNSAIYIVDTYAPADVLPTPPGTPQDGRLLRARRDGTVRTIANITGYEKANDPDGHGVESNPYAVLAMPDGSELVADAAGNDVLRVSSSGITVFHVFQNVTGGRCTGSSDPTPAFPGCNYVPTSLARDSAGNVYVGGLGSEAKHQGEVSKLSPDGSQVLKTWSGFTSVAGVAVGPDGTLYVSQLEAPQANPPFPQVKGVVTKVTAGNVRTNVDVPFPAGLAADNEGNLYVSAWSISPETGIAGPGTDGQVWRLHL